MLGTDKAALPFGFYLILRAGMTAWPNGAVNIAGVHAPGSSAFEGKRDACGAYRKEYRLAAV